MGTMTKLLEEAVAQARELPDEEQDELAVTLLTHMRGEEADYLLTPEQIEEVKRRQQELRTGKGRFATDEEMEALWKKCGL